MRSESSGLLSLSRRWPSAHLRSRCSRSPRPMPPSPMEASEWSRRPSRHPATARSCHSGRSHCGLGQSRRSQHLSSLICCAVSCDGVPARGAPPGACRRSRQGRPEPPMDCEMRGSSGIRRTLSSVSGSAWTAGPRLTGTQAALGIWGPIMQAATRQAPPRDFTRPPGVILARVDRLTGRPVSFWCVSDDTIQEAFREDMVPSDECGSAALSNGLGMLVRWTGELFAAQPRP